MSYCVEHGDYGDECHICVEARVMKMVVAYVRDQGARFVGIRQALNIIADQLEANAWKLTPGSAGRSRAMGECKHVMKGGEVWTGETKPPPYDCALCELDRLAARLKEARKALTLADFLTSDEPEFDYGSGPECPYCDTKTATADGEHFIHRPACEWWLFRQALAALDAATKEGPSK